MEKLPKGLLEAFEQNKKIVFFLNPPYGAARGKAGVSEGNHLTITQKLMTNNNVNGKELITQFLYRITYIKEKYNLSNCYVCCYTNPSWLVKPSYLTLRKYFFKHFSYKNGCLFQASNFGDVSSGWGITFNIWKNGQNNLSEFYHTLIENKDGEINVIGDKLLYNFDNNTNLISTSHFASNPLKSFVKTENYVMYAKDLKNMIFEYGTAKIYPNYLSAFFITGNDIQQNNFTSIRPVYPKIGSCAPCQITKDNFNEASFIYSIRKLISSNWINTKDQYIINSDITIPIEFQNDCIIYTVFDSYCCSIRQDGHYLNNEFFWMSKKEIEELANDHHNDECYSDVHTASERFVYEKLQMITLSDEAQAVLNKASEIVRKTFKYRPLFDSEHPEYQINNWDCGWYQIKAIAKEYAKDDLEEFKKLYKALADKMRSMVYELGFLK